MFDMMPLVTLGLLVCLADPRPDADKVVERAIVARGKPDAKDDAVFKVSGAQKATPRGGESRLSRYTNTSQGADRNRSETVWSEDGWSMHQVTVNDGDRYWSSLNGVLVPNLTPAPVTTAGEAVHLGNVGRLAALSDRKLYRLELLAAEEVEGEACDRVRVKSEGRPDIELAFSAKTHLLRRWTMRRMCEDGERREATEVLSAYKTFSGLKMATSRKLSLGGDVMLREKTVESVEFLPADQVGDLFTRP